jgi:hypothetical protein
MGTPAGTIAMVTGLSEGYIDRLLSGHSRNETFNKLREQYKEKNLRTLVGSRFELADLISKSLTVFNESLEAQDQRLRFESAKWIWDQVMPDLKSKNGDGHSDTWQITINQPHVQTAISDTMSSVAETLKGLHSTIASQDPDAHVKLGTDALNVSPTQLEVQEGGVQLDPAREGKTDLLTELIEEPPSG